MNKASRYFLGTFFFGIFLVGGLYAGYTVVRDLPRAMSAADWPVTVGNVVESKVRRRESKITKYTMLYGYEVDGRYYDGRRVTFMGSMFYSRPVELAERYPKGAKVSVHYSPEHPSVAVLETGVWWIGFGSTALVSVLFVAFGAFGLRVTFR